MTTQPPQESSTTPLSDAPLTPRERRYQALLDHSPYCVHELDGEGKVCSMNPAGLRMLGAAPECEVLGLDCLSIVSEADRPRIRMHLDEALAGRFSKFEFTTTTGRRLRANFVPLAAAPDDSVRLLGISEDITDRHNLERQLLQTRELEAVGRLAGGVAHDFNNLLTAITGSTALLRLRHGTSSPELQVLEEATAAAGELTRQLQSFARLRRATPQRLSLSGAVQDARALLRTLASDAVRLEVGRCEAGHVLIDPSDLNRVMVNLVTNAADALQSGGKITLSVLRHDLDQDLANPAALTDGAYLAFAVSDTGCGMPPEVRARLFEPFFTTKDTGPTCHGGTGLGLSTCHGIAGQARGGIEVESELGVGTTVTVYLPLARDPQLPVQGPAPRVLLVEDDPLHRQVVTTTLEKSHYSVLACASAEEALAREEDFDLLLVDLVLPGQSGLDLAKALIAKRPDLPVICTSGVPEAADRLLASGLHSRVAFLPKPHGTRELVELVERLLSRRPAR